MSVTDPIADMLTRIRNALMAKHEQVLVPSSRLKLSIARILKEEGFINDYEVVRGKPQRVIKIYLKYSEFNGFSVQTPYNNKRISHFIDKNCINQYQKKGAKQ